MKGASLVGSSCGDLVEEGVDCVMRAAVRESSALLVARQAGSFQWVTCASPDYVKLNGIPRSLAELELHQIVEFHSGRHGRATAWRFIVAGEEQLVSVSGHFAVNHTDAYVTCGLEGIGLIRIASFLVVPYLRSGQLSDVLPQYKGPTVPLSVSYPKSRHQSSAVRAFVEWTGELLRRIEPRWLLPS